MTRHGLGAIQSPPDDRDFPLDALYAITGTEKAIVIPPTFIAPSETYAPLNQGSTPQCVSFSAAAMKLCEDGQWPLDTGLFFTRIGGGPNGAVVRNAFDQLLKVGYPPDEANHKISAYFAVKMIQAEIQAAIMAFGPVVLGVSWYNSWFSPVAGVLPKPDFVAGGHAILAIGWDSRGLRLRNSWGTKWGLAGDCFLPWVYLAGEAWKAVDVPIPPAPAPIPPAPTPTPPEVDMIPNTPKPIGSLVVSPATNVRGVDLNTGALVAGVAGRTFPALFETTLATPISSDPDSVHVYAVTVGAQLVGILARNGVFTPSVAPAADRSYLVHLNVPGDVNATPTITKA